VLESCARQEQSNSLSGAASISANVMGKLSRPYSQICNREKDWSSYKTLHLKKIHSENNSRILCSLLPFMSSV